MKMFSMCPLTARHYRPILAQDWKFPTVHVSTYILRLQALGQKPTAVRHPCTQVAGGSVQHGAVSQPASLALLARQQTDQQGTHSFTMSKNSIIPFKIVIYY